MKTLSIAASLAVAALLAAAPAAHAEDSDFRIHFAGWGGVTGSGKLRTEARAVSGFQAIATRGSVKLVLRQGTREGLELRGDDNILPLIETRVVDRGGVPTLEIGTKDGASYSTREQLVATVDLVTLRSLKLSGSSDVVCEGLKTTALQILVSGSGKVRMHQLGTDDLAVTISGSGDAEFSGRAGKLSLKISGSGEADTRALEADDVAVTVAGSGDVRVNARKTLAVSLAGSGNVAYTGGATVTSSIAGIGRVKKL
jgi:hypothetical protein